MNYEDAKNYDVREFNEYFWYNLQYIQMLLFIIFRDQFNYIQTKVSMFVNIITFSLFFNTIFFNNGLIEAIYKNKGGLSFGKSFGFIILSSICTVLLNCIAKIVGLTKKEVKDKKKKLKESKQQQKKDEVFEIKMIKKTNKYFIVILIITLVIWYFGIAFCSVYNQCQKNLVFNVFMTWLIIMIYPIPLCYAFTKCRYEGIHKQNETLFKIGDYLQKIIMY